jgi:hypothetical protein
MPRRSRERLSLPKTDIAPTETVGEPEKADVGLLIPIRVDIGRLFPHVDVGQMSKQEWRHVLAAAVRLGADVIAHNRQLQVALGISISPGRHKDYLAEPSLQAEQSESGGNEDGLSGLLYQLDGQEE